MSGPMAARRILAALTLGDRVPDEIDGMAVAWTFDLAPGEGDGIDELHYAIELWTLAGVVVASFSERSATSVRPIATRALTPDQIATVLRDWEELYGWPYAGELEEVAA